MKNQDGATEKFFVHIKRPSGYEATVIVEKGKQHRDTVFTALSSGAKIISNKKLKPFPETSVEEPV
jgi:hypothetical protein